VSEAPQLPRAIIIGRNSGGECLWREVGRQRWVGAFRGWRGQCSIDTDPGPGPSYPSARSGTSAGRGDISRHSENCRGRIPFANRLISEAGSWCSLVSTLDCQSRGRGFKSRRARHPIQPIRTQPITAAAEDCSGSVSVHPRCRRIRDLAAHAPPGRRVSPAGQHLAQQALNPEARDAAPWIRAARGHRGDPGVVGYRVKPGGLCTARISVEGTPRRGWCRW
jgi:hypothetical protein